MDYKELIDNVRNVRNYSKNVLHEPIVEDVLLRAASALEILLAERDSAMRDIRKTCKTCAFYGTPPTEYPCGHCALVERMWKWRGLQKGENHD